MSKANIKQKIISYARVAAAHYAFGDQYHAKEGATYESQAENLIHSHTWTQNELDEMITTAKNRARNFIKSKVETFDNPKSYDLEDLYKKADHEIEMIILGKQ